MIKRKIRMTSILFYILFLALMIFSCCSKVGYNIDEMLSYGLANHEYGLCVETLDGYTYEPAVSAYQRYFTAVDGLRFDYDMVWRNQASDVHPPLFYVILHTICSLRPNAFSRWHGLIINIVFQLFILYFVRKTTRILAKENEVTVNIVSAIYIMVSSTLFITAFIRMYVMVTFFSVYMTYIIIKRVNGVYDKLFWLKLYIAAVCGALTHYYCIVYIVLLCTVLGIILLVEKDYKNTIKLILTGSVSGATAIYIFPAMISHIFSGYRGKQSFENMQIEFSEKIQKFKTFFDKMNKELFGGILLILITIIFILLLVEFKRNKKIIDIKTMKLYIIILAPAVMYFTIMSNAAVMILSRYMILVYPMILMGVIGIFCELLNRILNKKMFICLTGVLSAFIIINSYINPGDSYLCKEDAINLNYAKEHANLDTLYMRHGKEWELACSALEVSEYKSVMFVDYETENYLDCTDFSNDEEIIVFIQGDDHSYLDDVMEKYPQFKTADCIGIIGYTTTYHLY